MPVGRGGPGSFGYDSFQFLYHGFDVDLAVFRIGQVVSENPQHVQAVEQRVDHRRGDRYLTLPHQFEETLHGVGQVGHLPVSEHSRRAFKGVSYAENFLQ